MIKTKDWLDGEPDEIAFNEALDMVEQTARPVFPNAIKPESFKERPDGVVRGRGYYRQGDVIIKLCEIPSHQSNG